MPLQSKPLQCHSRFDISIPVAFANKEMLAGSLDDRGSVEMMTFWKSKRRKKGYFYLARCTSGEKNAAAADETTPRRGEGRKREWNEKKRKEERKKGKRDGAKNIQRVVRTNNAMLFRFQPRLKRTFSRSEIKFALETSHWTFLCATRFLLGNLMFNKFSIFFNRLAILRNNLLNFNNFIVHDSGKLDGIEDNGVWYFLDR